MAAQIRPIEVPIVMDGRLVGGDARNNELVEKLEDIRVHIIEIEEKRIDPLLHVTIKGKNSKGRMSIVRWTTGALAAYVFARLKECEELRKEIIESGANAMEIPAAIKEWNARNNRN